MGTPSVSVVIPVYNVGPMASEAVRSVLGQTFPAGEIIVVDDGSSDDTAAQLAPFMGRIRYVRQENRGVASARNRGLDLATGDLVAFLDGDDVWHPLKLERHLAAWASNPGLGCFGTASYPYEEGPPNLEGVLAAPVELIPWSDLVMRNRLITSTILADRAVLREAGPFDEGLQGPEDHDLWIRMAEIAPAAKLAIPLTGYRTVPGSLSRRALGMESGMLRILEKLGERGAWEGPGRTRLKFQSYSYMYYSSSYIFSSSGDPASAIRRLLASVAWYPLPFARGVTSRHWARPRMMIRYLQRWASGLATQPGEGA